ncbi:hypothetical protein DPMN_043704 [Dreissena polymorpha]|uniref:Uncharacterized protein n=1 Tax=Dreissena polymorpha TaxID=45954 RepID=A0A9D4HZW3_DREPO|nr:hypothetical protein DPMN_043704 [Dreissena polymorpha]
MKRALKNINKTSPTRMKRSTFLVGVLSIHSVPSFPYCNATLTPNDGPLAPICPHFPRRADATWSRRFAVRQQGMLGVSTGLSAISRMKRRLLRVRE